MFRSLLFVAFFACCVVPQAGAQVQFQALSLDAALERAEAEEKHVLVFFSSKSCNKSALLAKRFFADPAYADAIEAAFVPILLDADASEMRTHYDRFELWGAHIDPAQEMLPAPRVLLLDAEGAKRGAVTGLPIDRIGETGEADFVLAGMRYAADLDRVFEVIMDAAQPVTPAAPLLDQ